MKRHLLIGRFGSGDVIPVPAAHDEVVSKLPLLSRNRKLDHGVQSILDDLNDLKIYPTEIGIDLVVLAAHVHAADTHISRSTDSQDTWTREIRLVVPVSNPVLWQANAALLKRILNFLTGDKWNIGFRSRPADCMNMSPPRTDLLGSSIDSICLFSGGLDSLIGAIDILAAGGTPLLVSHAGDSSTSDAQNKCLDVINNQYNGHFQRLRLWSSFSKGLNTGSNSENTTRGRSFLFFALGVFAGTGLGRPFVLKTPENGLIALNVPLEVTRLGSLSTRTTHPFYIARWNELLSRLGINGSIENPYWSMTKGEMAASCANQQLLKQALPHSLSCSSPAKGRWLGRKMGHCGYCLPCLIRRAAIDHALGAGNDPTPYYGISSLRSHVFNTLRAEGQQIRAFEIGIQRLRQKPDLAKFLIHKSGSLRDVTQSWNDLEDVYRRGMDEVATLLTGVRTRPR